MTEQQPQEIERVDGNEDDRIIPLYSLLPPQIRRKIKALKKLQFQTMLVNVKFYQDLHKLECAFINSNEEYFKRRADIVNGRVDPTDEECKFDEGYDSPDDTNPAVEELRSKLGVTKAIEAGFKGIPEFWLTTLKNVEITSNIISHHDEPILRHLQDITVQASEEEPMGFTISFRFAENPYFDNSVLTKEYEMKCDIDEELPWTFDGPEIVKATGCSINWKQGMDVTKKTVQKKQRGRTKCEGSTVVKTVQNHSFFNFFNPPQIPGNPPNDYPLEKMESILDVDYEVGTFIKEKLVPYAVLYYTGEALDDETSEESSSESEEEGGGDGEEYESEECTDKPDSKDEGSGDAGSDVE